MGYKYRLYFGPKISTWRCTTDTKRPLPRYSMEPRSAVKGFRKTVSTALVGLRTPSETVEKATPKLFSSPTLVINEWFFLVPF